MPFIQKPRIASPDQQNALLEASGHQERGGEEEIGSLEEVVLGRGPLGAEGPTFALRLQRAVQGKLVVQLCAVVGQRADVASVPEAVIVLEEAVVNLQLVIRVDRRGFLPRSRDGNTRAINIAT